MSQSVHRFVGMNKYLELNAELNRKSLKVNEHWCYVVVLFGTRDHSRCSVLHTLV